VYARLAKARDNSSISGQPIKLDVNGTVYSLTTYSNGCVTQPLSLVAVGGKATKYQIYAVFEGAGFKTRNLTITDPYGPDYPVCTTMQWDFKASQNSVTLTVEAPKTDVAAPAGNEPPTQSPEGTTVAIPPAKTPEQVQAEAEQSGWLTVWHGFTWWYPWYRLHFVYCGSPVMQFDVGLSPLPFADSITYAETFVQKIINLLSSVIWAITIGMATAEFFALLIGSGGPYFFAAALLASIALKVGSFLTARDSINALVSVFFGVLIPTVVSLVRTVHWICF
jgi:hypothetical protein